MKGGDLNDLIMLMHSSIQYTESASCMANVQHVGPDLIDLLSQIFPRLISMG